MSQEVNPNVERLQKLQYDLLDRLYAAASDARDDPSDSYKKLDHTCLVASYDQTVSDLQALHPDGANAPAYYCNMDLYSFFSDYHKDVYGCRYRGDASVAELNSRIPTMRLDATANAEQDAMYEAMQEREEQDQMAELIEHNASLVAYDASYDHHDPRI